MRARGVLLYRMTDPGPGFRFDDLPHAAVARFQNGSRLTCDSYLPFSPIGGASESEQELSEVVTYPR